MGPKNAAEAANALMDWFKSQDIDLMDAVPVMALVIAGICKLEGEEKAPRLVAMMIKDMMENMDVRDNYN